MGMDKKSTQMETSTKVTTKEASKTASVFFKRKTVQSIKGISYKIKCMVKESTNGRMAVNMMETGWRIQCMVRELLHGQMEESMWAVMLGIRKVGKDILLGRQRKVIKVNGEMARSMVLALSRMAKARNLKVSGTKEFYRVDNLIKLKK